MCDCLKYLLDKEWVEQRSNYDDVTKDFTLLNEYYIRHSYKKYSVLTIKYCPICGVKLDSNPINPNR